MRSNYQDLCGLVAICVGAVVGAGFASGQEINRFFVRFGWLGVAGIGIAVSIFIVWTRFIMATAYERKLTEYSQACRILLGPRLATLGDLIAGSYVFAGLAVMIAGGGEAIAALWPMPTRLSSLLFALLAVLGMARGASGLIKINKALVPLLLIIVLLVLAGQLVPDWPAAPALARIYPLIPALLAVGEFTLLPNWLVAGILYAAFNLGTVITVFSALGNHIPDTRTGKLAGLFSGLILGLLLFLFWSGIYFTPGASQSTLPMAYIAALGGYGTRLAYLLLLFLAMYTSAIADLFALNSRYRIFARYPAAGSLLVAALAWAVARAGFVRLINTVYPAYGYLWTAMLIIVVIRHRIAGCR